MIYMEEMVISKETPEMLSNLKICLSMNIMSLVRNVIMFSLIMNEG